MPCYSAAHIYGSACWHATAPARGDRRRRKRMRSLVCVDSKLPGATPDGSVVTSSSKLCMRGAMTAYAGMLDRLGFERGQVQGPALPQRTAGLPIQAVP